MDGNLVNIDGKIYNKFPPVCPYCNIELEKFPSKKTRCKSCNKNYFTCRHPYSEFHFIVTEEDNTKWKIERRLLQTIESLKIYGLSDSFIQVAINNNIHSLHDAVWAMFNKSLSINANNFGVQAQIYFSMAVFLRDEGKDPYYILQEALRAELVNYQSSNIKLDVQIISNKSCNCSYLNGRTYSVEDAIRLKFIPVKNCEKKYCSATYGGVAKLDKDGFPISKNKNQ
jgi:hypothetical protein